MRTLSPKALRIGAETFHALKDVLHERGLSTGVGDEGGFAPELDSTEAAIEAVLEAAERVGHRDRVAIALDPASTELYRDGGYHFERQGRIMSADELIDLYATLADRYPVVSIEDGLAEDEWGAWKTMTERLGDRMQLVGDDLFVTNVERFQRGIDDGVANAILVKVNQIGTLTESLDAIELARANGYGVVISHRSGETEDTTIADLVVATGAGQIKTGAPSQDRPRREVQPAAPDRGGARRRRGLSGVVGVPARATLTHPGATLQYMASVTPRRTKIVATIGPACSTVEKVSRARRGGDGRGASQPLARDSRRSCGQS